MNMDKVVEKRRWSPKRIIKFGLIGLFVLVIIYGIFIGQGGVTLKIKADHISISSVKRGKFQEYIPIIGNVLPLTTIYLDAEEGGRVEKKYVKAGSMVNKGDKIIKLSNTNLLITIMNNEALVNRAVNDLRTTLLQFERSQLELEDQITSIDYHFTREKAKCDRYKKLLDEKIISQADYDEEKFYLDFLVKWKAVAVKSQRNELKLRRNQLDQLELSVKQMQQNLELVKKQLEGLTIRAPISGHLTSLMAEVGESKAAGVRLGQIDKIEGFKVKAEIDEHYINQIKVGKIGKFDLTGKSYALTVEIIYPEVKEGKFEVDLQFNGEEPKKIKRGQTLRIRLQLSEQFDALLLARGGFIQSSGGKWVYVLDKSSKFAIKRDIKLGRQNPRFFEVLEGLEPGEKVITSSYVSFEDKQRLVLK